MRADYHHLRRDPSLLNAKSGGHNRTFLWEATRGNHPDLVKHLLKEGADPSVPGRIRSEIVVLLKPFCIAHLYGHPELAKILVQAGTVFDIFSACFLGDVDRVQELLSGEPSLLVQEQADDTVWWVTPLHFAVAGGHEGLTRYLISLGAKVKPYTRLLCDTAVRVRDRQLVEILLDGGADPELALVWGRM